MPSKYAPAPDTTSHRVINFFLKKLKKSGRSAEEIDKEKRRFSSIYSSVVNHAMGAKGQTRKQAHKYALKVYVEQAPKWAAKVLKKSKASKKSALKEVIRLMLEAPV